MDSKRERLSPRVLAGLAQTPSVVKQLRDVANGIRRDARQLAPKRTRVLSRNIQVERTVDSETGAVAFLVGWGPGAWYGWLVEAGTEDTVARPHLVPAAIKHGAVAPRGGAS